MTATTTAADLRHALARVTTAPVSVEHTGGGCATIYVGEFRQDGRALLAIGPGFYNPRTPGESRFEFPETYVGPDDDGEANATEARDVDHLVALVREWLATLDSALLTEPLPEDVEDIEPGTPAWEVSEAALELQRRAGQ